MFRPRFVYPFSSAHILSSVIVLAIMFPCEPEPRIVVKRAEGMLRSPGIQGADALPAQKRNCRF